MTENSNTSNTTKITIDLEAICGENRGVKAAILVRDHVLSLGYKANDASTKIHYLYNGLSEWWNTPSSMTVDGKEVNGGFRTRLGYAFNSHTRESVKEQVGTGHSAKPKVDETGNPVEKKAPVKRGTKMIGARFDLESGVVSLALENAVAAYDFSTSMMSCDLGALKYYSNALYQFSSMPSTFLSSCIEYDESGNPIAGGWTFGSYASTKNTASEAVQDILLQAVAKMDVQILVQAANIVPVKQGIGCKDEFITKWVPVPVVEKPVIETPLSETPMTADEEEEAIQSGKIEVVAELDPSRSA